MTDSYETTRKERLSYEQTLQNGAFGILAGTALAALALKNVLRCFTNFVWVYYALGVIGLGLVLLGAAYPRCLQKPCRLAKAVAGKLGRGLLYVLLGLIYVLLVAPVGLLLRGKRNAYGFYRWEEPPAADICPYAPADSEAGDTRERRELAKKRKRGSPVLALLALLREHGLYVLLPIALFLLLLGLLFVFASSGVAQYFIYTLF